MNKQDKLIKDLYKGLREYYIYSNNLEDILCTLKLEDTVYDYMPKQPQDSFNHKDCRFFLGEVETYLNIKGEK